MEDDTILSVFTEGCEIAREKADNESALSIINEVKLAIDILYELDIDTVDRLNTLLLKHLNQKDAELLRTASKNIRL